MITNTEIFKSGTERRGRLEKSKTYQTTVVSIQNFPSYSYLTKSFQVVPGNY